MVVRQTLQIVGFFACLMMLTPSLADAGKAFLETNAGQPGVVTTDSGLQYKVIKAGQGNSPKATDLVKVHYHGTLVDGTVFDSSVDRALITVIVIVPHQVQQLLTGQHLTGMAHKGMQ